MRNRPAADQKTETRDDDATGRRWYESISAYQWLVLVIASLGWVFDVFEGQIFVASMNEAMPELVPAAVRAMAEESRAGYVAFYNNVTFAAFLLGGSIGGVFFGVLSDRIGRARVLIFTILMYSLFTSLTALSQVWWHMALFRFLVAMGVGGEWAVASALVAEVFPKRARAWSLAIFHASGILGTYLAIAAGAFIVADRQVGFVLPIAGGWELTSWRLGFVLGAVPALLIVVIRLTLRSEPEVWHQARSRSAEELDHKMGRFPDLFSSKLKRRTFVGVSLAAVGLATFWGAHIYGKDVLRKAVEQRYFENQPAQAAGAREKILEEHFQEIKQWEMLGMLLVTTGGGFGLVTFGPLAERFGRRGAFLVYHVGALVVALTVFRGFLEIHQLLIVLPIFGFLTLGMHAGYAVYFPELFPTRLRSTGAGFCFNVGRTLAAPILFISGWMQRDLSFSLQDAASLLSCLFLLGAALLWLAPETRGLDLPE